jgi:hypothetical protein
MSRVARRSNDVGCREVVRGVALPPGMTRACLDEIARLLNRHQADRCEDTDDEGAVKVFEVVQRHLR